MRKTIQFGILLAVAISMASATGWAQAPGEATYNAKCKMCHGANGAADTPAGKATKTPALSDPDVKKLSADQMFDLTKNGKSKMPAFKDKITDAEIKDAVAFYRALK